MVPKLEFAPLETEVPIELGVKEEWMGRAACKGMDPDLFFPDRGESTKEAKALCLGCPVVKECLDYAVRNREKQGIWGGTSERQRRRLRRG